MPSRTTLTRDQARHVDELATEQYDMPSIILMENAGRGCTELLLTENPDGPVTICCGKGNNGGDGFVMARHLELAGIDVRVVLFADSGKLKGDALTNHRIADRAGIEIVELTDPEPAAIDEALSEAEWIVDALLGTGVTGEIRDPYAMIIERMNAHPGHIFSVDVPSGLDCDTGRPQGTAVRATRTATFVAMKAGFMEPDAADWTGHVDVIGIGVPQRLLTEFLQF